MPRLRFAGRIAGAGSTSGTRVVVGRWSASPFGEFADAMVETASGHRVLVAPTHEVADFVATTYVFDEIRVEPVTVEDLPDGWRLTSRSLHLDLRFGPRTGLGRLLRIVPEPVATHPAWSAGSCCAGSGHAGPPAAGGGSGTARPTCTPSSR